MGIDFQGADAHWGYGGFNRFRTKLALMIGVALDEMEGFSETKKGIQWSTVKDPIKILLDHSDCDGEITANDCKLVAPRLRELVQSWRDDDYDKQMALKLAKGMEDCALSGDPLIFC